jgi:hypothetical protein
MQCPRPRPRRPRLCHLLFRDPGNHRQLDRSRFRLATLAEMVGTTRSRVNLFMKKFQRLGFINYADGLKVNNALLTVVLHD